MKSAQTLPDSLKPRVIRVIFSWGRSGGGGDHQTSCFSLGRALPLDPLESPEISKAKLTVDDRGRGVNHVGHDGDGVVICEGEVSDGARHQGAFRLHRARRLIGCRRCDVMPITWYFGLYLHRAHWWIRQEVDDAESMRSETVVRQMRVRWRKSSITPTHTWNQACCC